MKSKIITLIIGILIGAIITTVGFVVYNNTIGKNSNQPGMMQMDENGPMGDGQNGEKGDAPTKPDGEEPPAKPDETDSEENS